MFRNSRYFHSRSRTGLFTSLFSVAVAVLAGASDAPAQVSRSNAALSELRDRLVAEFHDDIRALRSELERRNLLTSLAEINVWLEPVDHEYLRRHALPRQIQPDISPDLPPAERDWRVRLRRRREELAAGLYGLSRRAIRGRLPGFAWQLIHEVLWFDPDHQNARHLLGYQRFDDEWVTAFEAQMRRSNPPRVWHDRFGWLPVTHVERYENGERQFNSHWIPADLEAERRRDFRYAWEIETDHFLVRTNVSQERGVELAVLLEGFHDWFQRTYPEFFTSPQQLNEALQRGATRRGTRRRKPFVVHFYRTRDEYVSRLIRKNPQIGITNGIYMPDERIAHFFDDPDSDTESSLYHEATHQILFELQAVPREIGIDAHFWIIEGLACYMESFRQADGTVSVGTPSNLRFYWAQRRLVAENFYVPIGQLTRLGKQAFQSAGSLRQLYSQSSGLSHFFLHYRNGIYRDALVEYVAAIYGSRRGPGSVARVPGLDELTGVSYPELDQQYRSYITELNTDEVSATAPSE